MKNLNRVSDNPRNYENSSWATEKNFIFFLHFFVVVYSSSEVAKGLKRKSYGLVFGINTFLALLLQTILTLIVVDKIGFALEPKAQVLPSLMNLRF